MSSVFIKKKSYVQEYLNHSPSYLDNPVKLSKHFWSEIVSQIRGLSQMGFSKIGFPARHIMGNWLVSLNLNPSGGDDIYFYGAKWHMQCFTYILQSVSLGC